MLSSSVVAENAPAGTVVGTLSAVDPNAGDLLTFGIAYSREATDSTCFMVVGNQLIVRNDLLADYDHGITELHIRVVVRDSANNTLERDLVLQLTNDRSEDADGDGINEALEADMLGTSDLHFDDFTTADADGDGIPGLLEYAFNLDPLTLSLIHI